MTEYFKFQDTVYNDDRMFILYLCKCTITENNKYITTTIHYEKAPDDFIWSVITFRNNERYTAVKGNHFDSKEDAEAFIRETYPLTPLVSLNGKPPDSLLILEYQDFMNACKRNGFQEYDYKKMFHGDTEDSAFEMLVREK